MGDKSEDFIEREFQGPIRIVLGYMKESLALAQEGDAGICKGVTLAFLRTKPA